MRANLGLSKAQVYEVMMSIDTDRDGRIQLAEFVNRFKVSFLRAESKAAAGAKAVPAMSDAAAAAAAGDAAAAGAGRPSGAGASTGAGAEAAAPAAPASAPRPLAAAASSTGARRLSAADPWALDALARVGEALFSGARGSSATAVFASIDSNGDGILSKEEFCAALRALRLGFSEAEMVAIMDVVDVNRSGNINYIGELRALRYVAILACRSSVTLTAAARPGPCLSFLSRHFRTEFTSAFRFRDANAPPLHSVITSWAPGGGAAGAGGGAGEGEGGGGGAVRSGSGGWSSSGGESPEAAAAWQRGVIERIVAVLYEYRFELAAAFSLFDTDRSGKISRDELRIGLNSLSSLTGSPLTEGQADELMRALDTNGDGEIDWTEFTSAFRLIDTSRSTAMPRSLGPKRKSSKMQMTKGANVATGASLVPVPSAPGGGTGAGAGSGGGGSGGGGGGGGGGGDTGSGGR